MESIYILSAIGFLVGTVGTLIGAGGGFILVPLLLILHPDFSTEMVTAISMAAVASNALSGTIAYVSTKRIDYKAGLLFAICTIPGSILGVYTTQYIPRSFFDVFFGLILFSLSMYLFKSGGKKTLHTSIPEFHKGWIKTSITDKWNETYSYAYSIRNGTLLSAIVGYFSPLLGIGGGIIHVPAMVEWLRFPVHIATATSHFILAIMASISVIVFYSNGIYADSQLQHIIAGLVIGLIPGAFTGAYLSRFINGKSIIKALAICLVLVSIRLIVNHWLQN